MGRYTLELREIVESDNVKLFDFEYDFFDENLKPSFEKLFIDYFYFREIGQETIGRFKKELQTKLNLINHYYKEYYKTTKQVEIEEFMVTKDATDTFTRILEGESVASGQVVSDSNSNNSTNSTNKFYDTPRNKIDFNGASITNGGVDESSNNFNSNETNKSNSTQNNRTVETTILHSKGDLGVTSSGFLIQGWRDVITNIYQMIFDECEELFFQLF